jgi:hypothetical protein
MKTLVIAKELFSKGFEVRRSNFHSDTLIVSLNRPISRLEVVAALDMNDNSAEVGIYQSGREVEVIVTSNAE